MAAVSASALLYELPSHDGAQMARRHDVVQVSVNHRLNALGFSDVSEIGGPAYEHSVNVGMTDLVAALRWVRDNIENFGGYPDRVMIYGQSGGGSKVTTLMGMPSASGLFHRASVQSGGGGNIPTREQQKELARVVMKDLGLASNDIQSLQKIEWSRLFAAGNVAAAKINGRGASMGPGAPGTPRAGWSPCVDGKVINMRSFFDAAPEVPKHVPMLVGSVSEEGNQMSSRSHGTGVARKSGENLWRREGQRHRRCIEDSLPGEEDTNSVLYLLRARLD